MKYQEMFSFSDNDSRNIILKMIEKGSNVLEFGCANGNMTRYMSRELGCKVCIVEYEESAFQEAIQFGEAGVCGDILQYEWLNKFGHKFDYVIFADVLEHLSKPQEVLEKVQDVLEDTGSVIISVPNIAHNDILAKLYNNEFAYTATGLLDETHIHFFTERSLKECCEGAGYRIIKKTCTILPMGETEQGEHNESHVLRNILRERKNGDVYQNIVEIKKLQYCMENDIVNIVEKDSVSKIISKIYLDYGNGFSEEETVFVESVLNGNGEYECNYTLECQPDLKHIRFDPIEGEGCLICDFKVSNGKKELKHQFSKMILGEEVVLVGDDPSIEIVNETTEAGKISIYAAFALEGTERYIKGMKHLGVEVMEYAEKKYSEFTEQMEEKNKLFEKMLEERKENITDLKKQIEGLQKQLDNMMSFHTDTYRQSEQLEKLIEERKENHGDIVKAERVIADLKRQNEDLQKQLDNMVYLHGDACRQSTENYNKLVDATRRAEYWEQHCNDIYHSRSWKISRPIRVPRRIVQMVHAKMEQKQIEKTKKDAESVKFSILMPVYNVEPCWLDMAIKSVERQTYGNWELCIVDDASTHRDVIEYLKKIKNEKIKVHFAEENGGISTATNIAASMATGEFILLMDNDDEIAENALEEFFKCIVEQGADVIYSDQDNIDEDGRHSCPVYKPDWSPDLLRSQMYIGHLCGFSRELFEQVGGFRKEYDGSQDYDLLLRITERAKKIVHVDKVLYSWRTLPSSTAANPDSKPYAQYAGLNAVQAHLDRTFGKGYAKAIETENLYVYDVIYNLDRSVKVSIIIPTKDYAEDLKIAIDSIFEKSDYKNFEIIIMNNNSEEDATYEYFTEIQNAHKNVKVVDAFYDFNWSKLNNHGMREANGDVYIFLNNDVRILTEDWIERLVSKAMRKDTGAVGALLLYDDGTIQHGGVVVGMNGWADHIYKGMKPVHCGTPFISSVLTRNTLAVTGACMAVSKKVIDEIGGFDEDFMICGSDVELCIRAYNKGYVNIYDPYVKLFHYESKSRGTFVPDIDFELSRKMYSQFDESGDPYFNSNLDYYSCVPREKGEQAVENEGRRLMQVTLPELTPIRFRKIEYPNKRLNILLPSLNPEHVFGGIATAYKFFKELVETTGYDCRVILVDAVPSVEAIDIYKKEYLYARPQDDEMASKQILPFSDRLGKTIPVSDNDIFIFTGWWTAYCIQTEYQNWKGKDLTVNPFIYFIQDYEPGFYAWSTRYMLADATYKSEFKQIAVFNSRELMDYFNREGYKFETCYVFDPVLNDGLKKRLKELDNVVSKKKRILVYGRPTTARNSFELVVESLRKWVQIEEDVEDWEILSAGEQHDDVELGKGKYLSSVGKLTIEEYAKMLEETFAGISLMVSPHPSYPPLEMSVFGVKVITNKYANKDLAKFNDNMISLEECSPYTVAWKLKEVCANYSGEGEIMKQVNKEYCTGEKAFPFMDDLVRFIESVE